MCNQGWYEAKQPPIDPVTRALEVWALEQGAYNCTSRSQTAWENMLRDYIADSFPGYVHDHPNYFSRYMDAPNTTTNGWPAVHVRVPALGNETNEGWRRGGWWRTTGIKFVQGKCTLLFERRCRNDTTKQVNLETFTSQPVTNVELSFAPRVLYSDARVAAQGRWFEDGGECTDVILKGCFNNGTCVAPDTVCRAACCARACMRACMLVCAFVCACLLVYFVTEMRLWLALSCSACVRLDGRVTTAACPFASKASRR